MIHLLLKLVPLAVAIKQEILVNRGLISRERTEGEGAQRVPCCGPPDRQAPCRGIEESKSDLKENK